MSFPIVIRYPSHQGGERYVPVHRRGCSSSQSAAGISPPCSYTNSSRASSPSPSETPSMSSLTSYFSSSLHIGRPVIVSSSPSPGHSSIPVYTPADLLLLSSSPLSKLSQEDKHALHMAAPEVVLNRKRRKAQEWRARQMGLSHQNPHSSLHPTSKPSPRSSRQPESDGLTWRKSISI
ncbi:hypothetical protein EDC04DRAFT_2893636 [Pisolithus marmoratus]|nr:hypothetical protein EDC04DRAFT_2893636 [Pisolithus marmoratus]